MWRNDEARIADLEVFVHNTKRWPMHRKHTPSEYYLHERLRKIRNKVKEGKVSKEHQQRLAALERIIKKQHEKSKRVRLAG
jgi:ATP-dependent Lon protease